jgi:hypothetical protein
MGLYLNLQAQKFLYEELVCEVFYKIRYLISCNLELNQVDLMLLGIS